MTEQEFQTQMARLVTTYGPVPYSAERVRLIRLSVESFSQSWMNATVSELIGTMRHPPLLDSFEAAASIERERIWKKQKEVHAQDAKDFFTSRFVPEEKRMICQTIINRMLGQVPDDHWAQFTQMLDDATKLSPAPPKPIAHPPMVTSHRKEMLPYADN